MSTKLYVWVFEILPDNKACPKKGYYIHSSRKRAENRAKKFFAPYSKNIKFDYMGNTAQVLVDNVYSGWIIKMKVNQ